MKKFLLNIACATLTATFLLSNTLAYATELPKSITFNDKEFVMDITAGGGPGTATPDKSITMLRTMAKNSYKVLGSDVRLYIDPSHGHGGDHFAAGWVQATAPRFTARAEVWCGDDLDTTGSENRNEGDIARATSHLAMGIVPNARPRIFYSW